MPALTFYDGCTHSINVSDGSHFLDSRCIFYFDYIVIIAFVKFNCQIIVLTKLLVIIKFKYWLVFEVAQLGISKKVCD